MAANHAKALAPTVIFCMGSLICGRYRRVYWYWGACCWYTGTIRLIGEYWVV